MSKMRTVKRTVYVISYGEGKNKRYHCKIDRDYAVGFALEQVDTPLEATWYCSPGEAKRCSPASFTQVERFNVTTRMKIDKSYDEEKERIAIWKDKLNRA